MKNLIIVTITLLFINMNYVLGQTSYSYQTTENLQKAKADAITSEDFTKASEIKNELVKRDQELEQIAQLQIALDAKVKAQDFEGAAKIKEQIQILKAKNTQKDLLRKDISNSVASEDFEKAVQAKKELETLLNNSQAQLAQANTGTKAKNELKNNSFSSKFRMAASDGNSIFIKDDGTVWSWGRNDHGQIGNGGKTDRNTHVIPAQLNGLTECIAVSIGPDHFAGAVHSLALKKDGTVWAWGSNKSGQLGNATNTSSNSPVKVNGLTDIIAISCGEKFSLALKKDGTVWAWGENKYGQLGIGTKTDSNLPVKVINLEEVLSISAGYLSSFALKKDGTIWAWGFNKWGQLGDGTKENTNNPIKVPELSDVALIAAGGNHTLVLKKDGTVWTWGMNYWGQLGDGTKDDKSKPIKINGLEKITSIAGGACHSLAIKDDGTVMAWGANYGGQLGDSSISWHQAYNEYLAKKGTTWASPGVISGGRSITSTIPVKVVRLTDIVGVSAGNNHSMALKNDGSLWIFGDNGEGQLGLPQPPFYSNVPIKVTFIKE